MEALGPKLRRQRRRLGLTLDELAAKAGISKPYLSLIETGRVANPPSDEKLRRLEQTLGFTPGELITQAHLQRTPRDVRAVLAGLMKRRKSGDEANQWRGDEGHKSLRVNGMGEDAGGVATLVAPDRAAPPPPRRPATSNATVPLDLDDAYLSGVLAELVDRHRGNIEPVPTNHVPVINKVQAGYPSDFTDLSYPRGVADEYLSCPEVRDPDAFAARVHGESMAPKYRQGDIVIFSPSAGQKNGDDCFIRFDDGQTTFKRIYYETDENGKAVIRLQPRNPRFRPQIVPRERVTGVYRAVYRYQRLDEE